MQKPEALSARKVAILVDAENISADHWRSILRAASRHGRVAILRCFGDFSGRRHEGWLEICRQNGGQAVTVLPVNGTKNGADIALTIDAMDIVHAAAAEVIALVSCDADFAPLAQKITAIGGFALGIGLEKSPDGLRRAFDSFVDLTAETGTAAAAPKPLSPAESDLLHTAIAALCAADETGSVGLSRLGLSLRRDHPHLADRIGNGKLLRVLRQCNLCREHGSGPSLRVSPRPAALLARAS